MCVTIHFEGRLRTPAALDELRIAATQFAAQHQWRIDEIPNQVVTLPRVRENEEPWNYTGLVSGLVLIPNEDCDPVRLEFDENFYIQEFTKTQFASTNTHVDVVLLLRAIEPFFESLTVDDEGEYWDSGDVKLLQQHLEATNKALQEELKKHPDAVVKVKTPEGRIIDMITY